jgi:hypothetical protein
MKPMNLEKSARIGMGIVGTALVMLLLLTLLQPVEAFDRIPIPRPVGNLPVSPTIRKQEMATPVLMVWRDLSSGTWKSAMLSRDTQSE